MKFKMRIDEEADEYLPGLEKNHCDVEISEADFSARLGNDFEIHVGRGDIDRVRTMEDPRPTVFLPLGISAAVEQLGSDTLVVIGSYDGLVLIDFARQVEAKTTAEGLVSDVPPDHQLATVYMRHLILSVENREEFVRAVSGGMTADGASPAAG